MAKGFLGNTGTDLTPEAKYCQFKDIEILAIILVPLIMNTLQGSYWADQKDSHNEVIMTSLQGQ